MRGKTTRPFLARPCHIGVNWLVWSVPCCDGNGMKQSARFVGRDNLVNSDATLQSEHHCCSDEEQEEVLDTKPPRRTINTCTFLFPFPAPDHLQGSSQPPGASHRIDILRNLAYVGRRGSTGNTYICTFYM